jgi:hypothetical protein
MDRSIDVRVEIEAAADNAEAAIELQRRIVQAALWAANEEGCRLVRIAAEIEPGNPPGATSL